jgi:hypothetical protein
MEPLLPSTPSFWNWVAPSTTITRWSLFRSWVLILKEGSPTACLLLGCCLVLW